LPDGFVGSRIQKSLDKNIAFEITRCLLEFSGTGNIELLLFNSAVKAPIFSKVVAVASGQQVVALNWRLDNTGTYFQGDYFFGYITKDLTVLPFKRDYESANRISVISHLCFTPIVVSGVQTKELFDLSKINNVSESWGLNPDVTVFNDYTDLVIQNEMLFATAIQTQMVINSIQQYIASERSNRTERMSNDRLNLLIAQLEGVPDQITGLIPTLRKDVAMLNKELKRIINGYFASGFMLNRTS